MKLFDKLKQRHQEKLDSVKKYPVKYLYQVEVGQFTISEDNQKGYINFHYKGEELVLAEEIKGEELVKYLKKTYQTSLGAFLPDYHDGEFNTVRYFRIPSKDNLVLPSPTIDQSYKMRDASFEGINNQNITKLITTKFGKKNADCILSLNDIRQYEDIANGRNESDNDYIINLPYDDNNTKNNQTESITCSEDTFESNFDYECNEL